MAGPLGRLVEHDPASRNFEAPRKTGPLQKVAWTRSGAAFDQGNLGSCTGNAMAGVLNTAPFHVKYARLKTEADAVTIYKRATVIDGFPGAYPPDDTGSSGLAVCKAAKEFGWLKSYTWAFGIQHALEALQLGPVITGLNWYSSMDHPAPSGLVSPSGYVRGGHEIEAYAYHPDTDLVWFWNSWGRGWGWRGRFNMTSKDWGRLLDGQGDVTVPKV